MIYYFILLVRFQLARSFSLNAEDTVMNCVCDESIFTPKAQMTIQLNSFLDSLHLEFLQDNPLQENVNLKVTYDFNPLKHFPDYPNGTLPAKLLPNRQLPVGARRSSFKCTADETVELDFFPYHISLTINNVHLQAYDIFGGKFSPGKKIKHILELEILKTFLYQSLLNLLSRYTQTVNWIKPFIYTAPCHK